MKTTLVMLCDAVLITMKTLKTKIEIEACFHCELKTSFNRTSLKDHEWMNGVEQSIDCGEQNIIISMLF